MAWLNLLADNRRSNSNANVLDTLFNTIDDDWGAVAPVVHDADDNKAYLMIDANGNLIINSGSYVCGGKTPVANWTTNFPQCRGVIDTTLNVYITAANNDKVQAINLNNGLVVWGPTFLGAGVTKNAYYVIVVAPNGTRYVAISNNTDIYIVNATTGIISLHWNFQALVDTLGWAGAVAVTTNYAPFFRTIATTSDYYFPTTNMPMVSFVLLVQQQVSDTGEPSGGVLKYGLPIRWNIYYDGTVTHSAWGASGQVNASAGIFNSANSQLVGNTDGPLYIQNTMSWNNGAGFYHVFNAISGVNASGDVPFRFNAQANYSFANLFSGVNTSIPNTSAALAWEDVQKLMAATDTVVYAARNSNQAISRKASVSAWPLNDSINDPVIKLWEVEITPSGSEEYLINYVLLAATSVYVIATKFVSGSPTNGLIAQFAQSDGGVIQGWTSLGSYYPGIPMSPYTYVQNIASGPTRFGLLTGEQGAALDVTGIYFIDQNSKVQRITQPLPWDWPPTPQRPTIPDPTTNLPNTPADDYTPINFADDCLSAYLGGGGTTASLITFIIAKMGEYDQKYFHCGVASSSPIAHGFISKPSGVFIYPKTTQTSWGLDSVTDIYINYTGTGDFYWMAVK